MRMPLTGIDDKDMLKGINLMSGFEKFMQTEEEDTECDRADIVVGDSSIWIMRKRIKMD